MKYIISGKKDGTVKSVVAYSDMQAWVAINVLTTEGYGDIKQKSVLD